MTDAELDAALRDMNARLDALAAPDGPLAALHEELTRARERAEHAERDRDAAQDRERELRGQYDLAWEAVKTAHGETERERGLREATERELQDVTGALHLVQEAVVRNYQARTDADPDRATTVLALELADVKLTAAGGTAPDRGVPDRNAPALDAVRTLRAKYELACRMLGMSPAEFDRRHAQELEEANR